MRDSIYNVKSSGLGGVLKDINRTGKLVRRVYKERQARKEWEYKAQLKANKKALKETSKRQKELEKQYKKDLPKIKKGQERSTSFKMNKPVDLKGILTPDPTFAPIYNKTPLYSSGVFKKTIKKGTIHPVMKNYKVPTMKELAKKEKKRREGSRLNPKYNKWGDRIA